jgi:hypothetical protein
MNSDNVQCGTQHSEREDDVTLVVDSTDERLVKSTERVRDLGEVFTPNATVQEMLDLLPHAIWATHPSPTFLEPACGDGNFLVAIFDRKLDQVSEAYNGGILPAGTGADAAQFHGLEALASIYAVDISVDNVVGGRPGHEVGARHRLLSLFSEWNTQALGKHLTTRSLVLRAAEWIVEHNVLVGNMLPFDTEGRPTGRDALPLIDYAWDPAIQSVVLHKTTLGDVIIAEMTKTAVMLSLFGPIEPVLLWSGKATSMSEAARVETPKLRGPARNGTGRRS